MEEDEAGTPRRTRARHIKKKTLKNKALSVAFDEKDLRDFVTGFHKRKKKRRKEAEQQLQEVQRRKRIEARKKRKLEREFVLYGGVPAGPSAGTDEGTTMYDNVDVRVTVTTSEISHKEESPRERPEAAAAEATLKFVGGDVKKHHKVSIIKKKPFKRVVNNRSRRKPQTKRDKNKGKKRNKTPQS
ncbi:hypothetical protein U1Q18_010760 [Sarracenia purpurea var. burkii]